VLGFAVWTRSWSATGSFPSWSSRSPLSPSSPFALKVMTVAAVALFPVVLAYQAWTYYTFRRRIV
jgi:cytochrome bd ubiquinol oxidase subunit II